MSYVNPRLWPSRKKCLPLRGRPSSANNKRRCKLPNVKHKPRETLRHKERRQSGRLPYNVRKS